MVSGGNETQRTSSILIAATTGPRPEPWLREAEASCQSGKSYADLKIKYQQRRLRIAYETLTLAS